MVEKSSRRSIGVGVIITANWLATNIKCVRTTSIPGELTLGGDQRRLECSVVDLTRNHAAVCTSGFVLTSSSCTCVVCVMCASCDRWPRLVEGRTSCARHIRSQYSTRHYQPPYSRNASRFLVLFRVCPCPLRTAPWRDSQL